MANNTIALQALAPQFEMPVAAQAKALQVRALQDEEQQRQRLQQQAAEDDASQRAALQGDPTGGQSYLASLAGSGNYKAFSAGQKANAELAKSGAETKHKLSQADAEHMKTINDAFTMHRNLLNTVNTPEDAAKWMEVAFKDPLVGPIVGKFGDLQAGVSKIPTDPAKFAEWKLQAGLSADQYVKYTNPDANTVANNKQSGANAKLSSDTTRRGQNMTAATAARGQDMTAATAAAGQAAPAYDSERGVLVNKGTGTAAPVTMGGKPLTSGKALTEFQGKSAAFGDRAVAADAILNELGDAYSPAAINAKQSVQDTPIVGGAMGAATNAMLSENDQRAEQAQRDFINAVLRQESGAAIAASEFQNAKRQYFPQPGDGKEVIAQKAENRRLVIEGFRRNAGANVELAKPPAPRKAAPAAKNAKGWTLHTDAQGNKAYVSPDGRQFEEVK